MNQITKVQWEGFSGKQKWDIMSAMRGPDLVGGEMLKWHSTSVLRAYMANVIRVGGLVNYNWPFVVLPELSRPREGFDAFHFFSHIEEACAHMGVEVLWVPMEEFPYPNDKGVVEGSRKRLVDYIKETSPQYYNQINMEMGINMKMGRL